MTRAELAAEAARLRSEGLYYREIAERMGISVSYASDLVLDPDGSKVRARKDSYRGTCENCGAKTDGSNGPEAAPQFCKSCYGAEHAFWTRERIIEAIREYHARYGQVVTSMDWNHAFARLKAAPERLREIERRWNEGRWPGVGTVQEAFGSWNAAIEAAGFAPVESSERRDYERWRANLLRVTDEEILASLRAAGNGHVSLSVMEYRERRRPGDPAHTTVLHRFGSWNRAVAAAGYTPLHGRRRRAVAA